MNYKLIVFFLFILLNSCEQHGQKNLDTNINQRYKNSGFALIYNDKLKKNKLISKKIDSRELLIFHKSLRKKSFVKITNPTNQKTIIAEVASNKVKFSNFYNAVITKRIAEEISLNVDDPYIDLVLISHNSTFIAKKAKTFEEEKNVAEKVPVEGITIDNLSVEEDKKLITKGQSFLYTIKVADFYHKDSASKMIDRIKNETNLNDIVIKKLSNTKYRVLLGPFSDIKKLKQSFNEMLLLNFENLEILRNV